MNARAKYEELKQEAGFKDIEPNQKSLSLIVEIVQAADTTGILTPLLTKALAISGKAPKLSPTVVFQIAADEIKVDELCNTL
jgi:hypothetical protein